MLRVDTRALFLATKSLKSAISFCWRLYAASSWGLLHGIDFLELVVIAHIAGQLLIVHVIDQVDDTVQEGEYHG